MIPLRHGDFTKVYVIHLMFYKRRVKFCLGLSLNFLGHLPSLYLSFFRPILIDSILFFLHHLVLSLIFCSNFN